MAPDLAVDGIDEVLALMLAGDWSDEVVPEASGATVLLEGGGHRWAVTLQPEEVTQDRADDGADPDLGASTARVAGEPGCWCCGCGDAARSRPRMAARRRRPGCASARGPTR